MMKRYPQVSVSAPRRALFLWTLAALASAVVGFGSSGSNVTALAGPAAAALATSLLVLRRGRLGGAALSLMAGLVAALLVGAAAPAGGLRALLLGLVAILGARWASYVLDVYAEQLADERSGGREMRDVSFAVSEAVRAARGPILLSTVAASGACLLGLGEPGVVLASGCVVSALTALSLVPAVLVLRGEGSVGAPVGARRLTVAAMAVAALLAPLAWALRGQARPPDGGFASSLGQGVAAGLWLVLLLTVWFRSPRLASVALLAPALCALLGFVVSRDVAVVTLALAGADSAALTRLWLDKVRFQRKAALEAAREVLLGPARALVAGLFMGGVALCAAGLLVASAKGGLVAVGLALLAASLASGVTVAGVLARTSLPMRRPEVRELQQAGISENTPMDPRRNQLSQYTDDELARMTSYDFFALAGKTVIRHGGNYGTRRLLYEMDLRPGMKVLEVGAGLGATAFTLAGSLGAEVTGVDPSEYMVEATRRRAEALGVSPRSRFVHHAGEGLPFESGSFDALLTESVVMYAGAGPVFSEAFRVLKPGAVLGLHDWSWVREPPAGLQGLVNTVACCCDVSSRTQFFPAAGWEQHLRRNGFDILFSREYPFAYFTLHGMVDDEGAMGVARLFGRVLARPAAMKKMLSVMALLDRYQEWLSYTLIVARKSPTTSNM